MNRFEEFSNTYQILEKLGEGSGGVVYLAYHRRLQKEVVLKQIKSKGLSMADKRQEVDILKNLNHAVLLPLLPDGSSSASLHSDRTDPQPPPVPVFPCPRLL